MKRARTALAAALLCTTLSSVHADFAGKLPPYTVLGNPTGISAEAIDRKSGV